ncbi:C-type lectin domain family 4 member A-like [Poeciliopsis prolifica]|uniref:C-type lectin domain family 4 member A-like n=1 Tax=Poeciliopsis prolifica TaxID=188132 RepID=UPI0024144B2E|nr:C-type lectin domain family 4 member A-like [Poeciliopsis prolifica]
MENIGDNDVFSTGTVNKDKYSPEGEAEAEAEGEDESTALTRSRLYLAGFGIFGALVAGTIIYMSIKMAIQRENINALRAERKILIKERTMAELQELNQDKEKEPGCYSCLDNWILFNKKYMFYDKPAPWKTWEQSRRFCQRNSSDLVVIDDLEEQEFVSKHIKYYHSKQHGYWMGLQNVNNTWTWLDGRRDNLGFWAKDVPYSPGSKVCVLPERNPSNSWKQGMTGFLNKFICTPASSHRPRGRSSKVNRPPIFCKSDKMGVRRVQRPLHRRRCADPSVDLPGEQDFEIL